MGFRPTVYRYATEGKLAGWVSNTSRGVVIEVEGPIAQTDAFLEKLKNAPPPQADITDISVTPLPLKHEDRFIIIPSRKGKARTQVSPDIATCGDCLKELFDPGDRRYRYPFINCTNCGPRFTIIRDIPYDRDKTTMASFRMCPDCSSEYSDPLDRRFHAQPNACGICGPQPELVRSRDGKIVAKRDEAMKITAGLLKEGKILAVKGLGGFHLACNATNAGAVKTLRERKYRYDKPFALMARNLETIEKYCRISEEEKNLLTDPASPIVLLERKSEEASPQIAPDVAPQNRFLGFMLPYTPLHHLLFSEGPAILVMTSGNVSKEPISFENGEAFERLGNIADFFLVHNRPVHTRCDDSVTRFFPTGDSEMILRRSRGYVPSPLKAPFPAKTDILACGAHLQNTFALMKGDEIQISHHIGDLENLEALRAFEQGIEHFQKLFEIHPGIVAYDMHPEYLSTKYALEAGSEIRLMPVQHHHAHIASCMLDGGLEDRKVIGVAFDGTGYGPDGTLWGSEFLVADYSDYERVGHLENIPLPGGEKAIREPWRIGAVYLHRVFGEEFLEMPLPVLEHLDQKKWNLLRQMISQGVNTPYACGMGRLFDAVSSIIGVRELIHYEGQAAIELEMVIEGDPHGEVYPFDISERGGGLVIDPRPLIRGVVEDFTSGRSRSFIAKRFHNSVTQMIIDLCTRIGEERNIHTVILSGGVFQNMYLLSASVKSLKRRGFTVVHHRRIPPGDGGISAGQAVIAAKRSDKGALPDVSSSSHETR